MIYTDFEVEVPTFGDLKTSISEFGAIPNQYDVDTARINADAINKAIHQISIQGGGTVAIEKGVWMTGPIRLESNVRLYLTHQAILKFIKTEQDYPLITTDYEGTQRIRTVSPITADGECNIAISGNGIIDGSGDQWRPVKEWKLTPRQWQSCLKKSPYIDQTQEGGYWFPTMTAFEGYEYDKQNIEEATQEQIEQVKDYYDYYRPVMVSLKHCNKVLLEGVTFRNSPAWNIHPYFCENLTVRDLFIQNDFSAQNGDGIDVESCKNVEIYHTTFQTGDDAICLKAGKDEEARSIKGACENISIHDCVVYQAHGGFVIGSEMSRDVRNVIVERCNFIGTDVGVRIKSCIGRGGVVEDIRVSDINMVDIQNQAVILTMSYASNLSKKHIGKMDWKKEDIPHFRRIELSGIHAYGTREAIRIEPLDGYPDTITDITIDKSEFQMKGKSTNNSKVSDQNLIKYNDVTLLK